MTAHLEDVLAELRRTRAERDEAIAQQAASAEVLRVINASPGDLAPVFDAITDSAMRLCGAAFGGLWLVEGDNVRAAGKGSNLPKAYLEFLMRERVPLIHVFGRAAQDRPFLQITDLSATEAYRNRLPVTVASVELGGVRTILCVPLREGGAVVGIINLYRREVRPFSDQQIALVQSCADQAVIAMKNARLINETQESLARQTATSEILRVISRSPTDATPVFESIVQTAVRLLRCDVAAAFVCDATVYTPVAAADSQGLLADLGPTNTTIDPDANFPSRAILAKEMLHVPDWSRIELPEHERRVYDATGVKSALYLPLLHEGECIGLIALIGKRPNIFGPGEIAQAESFRDQALIAIQNARLFNETRDALERQTATADILKVIASSPSDVQPVFEAIAANSNRLIGGFSTAVLRFVGDALHLAAFTPTNAAADEVLKASFPRPLAEFPPFVLVRDGRTEQFVDTEAESGVPPLIRDLARLRGYRSMLFTPLMSNGAPIGMISVTRKEPGAFAAHHVQLLQTFADQAVIAIQNARLFNETQEALERQTATANVLKVISRSVSDAAPVFEAILESCRRLFGLEAVAIYLVEGDMVKGVAQRGWGGGDWGRDTTPLAGSSTGLAIAERRAIHFPDLADKPDLPDKFKLLVREAGGMSVLYAPMLTEDRGLGSIVVSRKPAKPFTDTEISLIKSFADQAAIAIQNARMFNETQEALKQQTATADVLKVISRSAFDLQTILDTLIASAVDLCEAYSGIVFILDGDVLRYRSRAGKDDNAAVVRYLEAHPISPGRGTVAGRVLLSGAVEAIPDRLDAPEYDVPIGSLGDPARSFLGVPLLGKSGIEGVIVLARDTPGHFPDRQIDLVRTFADQAVIAIENARLFGEVQAKTRDLTEALERQTATNEVLSVISRSPSDLMPVLEAISDTAARLCGSEQTIFFRFDGEVFRFLADWNFPAEVREMLERRPIWPGHPSALGRAGATLKPVYIPDVLADPDYGLKGEQNAARYRTSLAVPLLRDGKLIGALSLNRSDPGSFTARHAELVGTFADQAVIAIENVRLFEEVQARTRDLTEALVYQTGSSNILRVIAASPTDVAPVLKAIVDSACEVCDAYDAAVLLKDGDHLRFSAHRGPIPIDLERWPINRGWVGGRAFVDRKPVHVPDLTLEGEEFPDGREFAQRMGHRTILAVPLAREGESIGAIVVRRTEAHPFSDKQIALLQTFADQAVIAIGNVRLFDEVQAKSRELSDSLEQQTAAAEILRVISSSPTDVQPVFEAIARSAAELCGATNSGVFRLRDGRIHLVGHHNVSPEQLAYAQQAFPAPLDRGIVSGRAILSRAVVHIPDIAADAEYMGEAMVNAGFRSALSVPMLRNGEPIGAINVTRTEPRPFSDRQVELLKTFADQAVIAINNVGLFNETQEALQQQTATADVLKVISRSVFDLQAVLDTLVESACRLCGASTGLLYLRGEDAFECAAIAGVGVTEANQLFKGRPIRAGRGTAAERVILSGEVQSVTDFFEDPDFDPKLKAAIRAAAGTGAGIADLRSTLAVPMKRDDAVVGVIAIARTQTGPFPQRQVELLQTFADQAVIAIENARLFEEVQARTRDLAEALQQQTATADVLKVISRSAFDLQTVFDTLLGSAVALSGADGGVLCIRDGDAFRCKSFVNKSPDLVRFLAENPIMPGPGSVMGRVALSGRIEWVEDTLEDAVLSMRDVIRQTNDDRALVGVPLLREGRIEGAIVLGRGEPGRFSARSIELAQTFADQAVIAIENVRLFEEVQARTRDLSEALQQQTATADVLKVISRSAFDLDTVLQTLVQSAQRLCNARGGMIFVRDGEVYRIAAHVGMPETFVSFRLANPLRADRLTAVGRVALTGEMVHLADALADPDIQKAGPQLGDFRAVLSVPLVRDNAVVGIFALNRPEPGAFAEGQVKLVQTFADQAAIAIANVRLFNEVQARTRDLEESLAQQTATADVLKVISRSVFDLNPVLQTLIDTAVRLARGSRGTIWIRKGDVLVASAFHQNVPAELRAYLSSAPRSLDGDDYLARAARDKTVVHIPDLAAYEDAWTAGVRQRVAFGAGLWVPLVRDGETIGVFGVPRDEPIAFTAREIEIVRTFADQAVIAIENARLFDEVQARTRDLSEALQLQTKTSDVLKVISRSAFDLQAVFDTLISSAVDLCGAFSGTICVRDGGVFRYRGSAGAADSQALTQYLAGHPATPGRGSMAGRVLLSGKVEAIPDRLEDPGFVVPMDAHGHAARALLGVPLLGKDGIAGALVLTRKEPGHFTTRQIEIVQTFADQAVIAIENVRLFDEVQARTKELAASLDDLRAAQDRLIQSEKLASLGQLTAGIAHEIKNPLNFVNNFSTLSRELIGELGEALENAPLDKAQRGEVEDLIGMVASNLDKVVQHGKRADSIVKNMLLHSREGSGERASVNINAMVEEALNLAYHGARAEKPGFNVTIAKTLDPNAGVADLYGQEMTRVLLNLTSNGFYATTKRRQTEANSGYEPTLTVSTRDLGDRVEIAIRDNGTGIPDEVKAKMFNPFFTTKPAGEGTGLGLSLSHDIVVKQHGGAIEVATEPGAYTQFTIQLPRTAQGAPAKPGAVR